MTEIVLPFTEEHKSWERVHVEMVDCPILEGFICTSFIPCRKCHHYLEYMGRKQNV